jgi:integrase
MVRICKDGKKKYVSVGISVKAKHWNFDKNEPKPNCPNREHICLLIASKKAEYEKEAIKLKSEGRDYTADGLHEKIQSPTITRTVADIFDEYIEHLRQEKRTGYMKSVLQVYNSLVKYNGHLNIYFDEIDFRWLREYEIWLKGEGLAVNTIGIRFRTLRAIYNYALTNDWVNADNYPFKKYKVSKLSEETIKRALSKKDINKIIKYPCSSGYTRLAIDIFAFTYYVGGINFVDIANLTHSNIINGNLVYKRQKTGKLIRLPLPHQAMELIYKYRSNTYLFPIFNETH